MSKTILLTGATDGIGLASAEKFAALGHSLLIHGRNAEKLNTLNSKLLKLGAVKVASYQADFSKLKEVKQLAEQLLADNIHIDVLINNAGVYKSENTTTEEGLDIRFAVNTISPYILTKALMPTMNAQGRIINLSSAAQAPVNLAALKGEVKIDDDFNAYAQSKLALTMWSRQLALSAPADSPIIIAVNPGSLLASKMVKEGFGVAGKDINIGADILLGLSLEDKYKDASGLYFDNDIGEFSEPHPDTLDEGLCREVLSTLEKNIDK